jgi:GTP cyclohydrolase I
MEYTRSKKLDRLILNRAKPLQIQERVTQIIQELLEWG